jgi:DNA-binding PadR family transcriptional regulator
MPKKKRIPDWPDELLLAAIERAECHWSREHDPGVPLRVIKEHLGLPHHGGTTRTLRPRLQTLERSGLTEHLRRHSRDWWTLTANGHTRLDAARGEIAPLPEAPQHRRWREAQHAASEQIAEFRGDLRGAVDEALRLLEADHESNSTAWYELSDRLRNACRRLASAIYCLREWPEPDDSHPDIDDPPYGQQGRREIRRRNRDLRVR